MIDTIGPLYTHGVYGAPDPVTGELEVITPPVQLAGWHVNTTPETMAARPDLEAFEVTPSALRRVWAGDDPVNPTMTVALRFEDEAEADKYLRTHKDADEE